MHVYIGAEVLQGSTKKGVEKLHVYSLMCVYLILPVNKAEFLKFAMALLG
jgi:hypothetical protein